MAPVLSPASLLAARLVCALGFTVAGAACTPAAGDARDLAVSSDQQARAVVDEALAALARGDERGALARFCDRSDEGRARTHAVLVPALGRSDLSVRRVEPAWVEREPYFFVEVQSADGAYAHGFAVRVRDGCLDRAVGASSAPPPVDDDGAIDL
jgi:hypothetical protein